MSYLDDIDNMDAFAIRVILADDHPVMLSGISHEFAEVKTIQLVGTARNSTELIALLTSTQCDVLVSDYAMPAGEYGDGIALFSLIKRRYPAIKIVVLTMLDNPAVIRALVTQGVTCIVSKSDAGTHLIPAVHAVHSGGKYYSPTINQIVQSIDWNRRGRGSSDVLSQRESEVVRLFASGLTVNEIAEKLSRSKKTISTQKSKAMEKLGIEREVDLFRYAMENGLVTSSQKASDSSSSTE
ncbi:two-component system capsular synthesis response regulator RcsB [Paraburkholderia atlantica]|uniref:response regulator transcription factor n=1 Tax=Paraburkholderia atlantica TaxID=2654982 RepID=UPI001617FC34|nr:response regulator transcription factor [Paraburkholderia atlantica]MBB5415427.1 two-component system capsular synthesis response regulator RcsB [Paraburkholderia atlantica]